MRALLAVAAATLVPFSAPATVAADRAVGDEHVLIVLATWGPQPFKPEDVSSAFAEAARFYDKSSFHQLELSADVTPWLPAFTVPAACPEDEGDHVPAAFSSGPDAAAAASGYRVEAYDRVMYVTARMACSWDGLGVGHEIVLNGDRNWYDMVHELGHTYGLAHARRETCRGCSKEEYGDPFSPMGHGSSTSARTRSCRWDGCTTLRTSLAPAPTPSGDRILGARRRTRSSSKLVCTSIGSNSGSTPRRRGLSSARSSPTSPTS